MLLSPPRDKRAASERRMPRRGRAKRFTMMRPLSRGIRQPTLAMPHVLCLVTAWSGAGGRGDAGPETTACISSSSPEGAAAVSGHAWARVLIGRGWKGVACLSSSMYQLQQSGGGRRGEWSCAKTCTVGEIETFGSVLTLEGPVLGELLRSSVLERGKGSFKNTRVLNLKNKDERERRVYAASATFPHLPRRHIAYDDRHLDLRLAGLAMSSELHSIVHTRVLTVRSSRRRRLS